jgi:hypothetical protein
MTVIFLVNEKPIKKNYTGEDHEGRFSPNTSVSLANYHFTSCSRLRQISGKHRKRTQCLPTHDVIKKHELKLWGVRNLFLLLQSNNSYVKP